MHRPFLDEQQRRRVARSMVATSAASKLQQQFGGPVGGRGRRKDKASSGVSLLGSGAVEGTQLSAQDYAGNKSSRNINYDALDVSKDITFCTHTHTLRACLSTYLLICL